ncbi:sensor histidine kinase [Mycolicibacterium mengxianglii]|uniref:sensor histidine kinase n=1 Tax=Mycolicibacterium mengxianglii TaxID=2736649 RepID=UPI0018D19688|nr:ATP-binding protein [Mycolicibacterium mengxianglii]
MLRTRSSSSDRSVARELFGWQLALLLLLIVGAGGVAVLDARRDADELTREKVIAVTESVALMTSTAAAIGAPDPTAILQPQTEEIRKATGMDFIVVMAPDRTRFTHTDVSRIGGEFTGNIDRALAGETFTETFAGTLGPSIRAVAPVFDADGTLVGLVSAGVTRTKVSHSVLATLPAIAAAVGTALALALCGAFLLERRLRRRTLGLSFSDLSTLYEQREAVLHAIGEGLLVFGPDGTAEVVNDEARRLLSLPDGPLTRAQLPGSLATSGGETLTDETHVTPDRVLLVNQQPVHWEGRKVGTVMTLRDRTDLQRVSGELSSVTQFAESLRSRAHEADNRLHTVITMVELGRGEQAVQFATAELAVSQHLIDRLMTTVAEPALAALLLGKISQARDHGVELDVTEDSLLDDPHNLALTQGEVVTLVGNLVDNAVEAARSTSLRDEGEEGPGATNPARSTSLGGTARAEASGWVEVTVRGTAGALTVTVADSGPGMTPDAFEQARMRGYSTKPGERGLGLALVWQVVTAHGGTITSENSYGSVITATIPAQP